MPDSRSQTWTHYEIAALEVFPRGAVETPTPIRGWVRKTFIRFRFGLSSRKDITTKQRFARLNLRGAYVEYPMGEPDVLLGVRSPLLRALSIPLGFPLKGMKDNVD